MELIIYPRLSTRSRRAIKKTKKRFGHPNRYEPRHDLVTRLTQELGWTENQVRDQIIREHRYLTRGTELSG